MISRQLLRSGTSVGANVEEAQAGQSKADFISKVSITLKEAGEIFYWVKLLKASEILSSKKFEGFKKNPIEIAKVIAFILISTKNSKN